MEHARNLLGIPDAEHEEVNPEGSNLLISRLACSLKGQSERITPRTGSRMAGIYGTTQQVERHFCSFGVNPAFSGYLVGHGLIVSALGEGGEVRGIERPDHPFFVATLYQPQLSSIPESPCSLILGYLHT